jgi:hypothetical protein
MATTTARQVLETTLTNRSSRNISSDESTSIELSSDEEPNTIAQEVNMPPDLLPKRYQRVVQPKRSASGEQNLKSGNLVTDMPLLSSKSRREFHYRFKQEYLESSSYLPGSTLLESLLTNGHSIERSDAIRLAHIENEILFYTRKCQKDVWDVIPVLNKYLDETCAIGYDENDIREAIMKLKEEEALEEVLLSSYWTWELAPPPYRRERSQDQDQEEEELEDHATAVWECADWLFFLQVKENVSPEDAGDKPDVSAAVVGLVATTARMGSAVAAPIAGPTAVSEAVQITAGLANTSDRRQDSEDRQDGKQGGSTVVNTGGDGAPDEAGDNTDNGHAGCCLTNACSWCIWSTVKRERQPCPHKRPKFPNMKRLKKKVFGCFSDPE